MEFLTNTVVADNPLSVWAVAGAITVVAYVLLKFLLGSVRRLMHRIASGTETYWDDLAAHVISRTRSFAVLAAAAYLGALYLEVSSGARVVFTHALTVILLVQAGLWASAGVSFFITKYSEEQRGDGAAVTTMNALNFVVRLALWTVVLLLVLDNMGVDITALITGLGVGGIAVALALQNILGDLFASLSIVLDKPFVVGDFIVVGDMPGSVEHVGLKTTRVRSLSGEQLVFSNADLLSSRIRNYGRMFERRILFSIGVTYDTPREKIKLIPQIIREAVEQTENTRFDRSHFKEYGNFSLNFETVYFVTRPEFNLYMDAQQAINLKIHERFEEEGIEFAYPTQTIYLAGGQQQSEREAGIA